jgi:hypothetical protein
LHVGLVLQIAGKEWPSVADLGQDITSQARIVIHPFLESQVPDPFLVGKVLHSMVVEWIVLGEYD